MRNILKCISCGKYTLKSKCECGGKAGNIGPVKFTIKDNYGKYRREAKRELFKKEGYI